jgi:two-component system, OmpR family, flagellar system response regulator FtcR
MIVVVDERVDVTEAYKSAIGREGYSAAAFGPMEFEGWFHALTEGDARAIDAVVLGDFVQRVELTKSVKRRFQIPTIALNDVPALDMTLRLFEAGVDDVVRKPVHVRELIARIAVIKRRPKSIESALWSFDGLVIHGGGRCPTVNGKDFQIPRRELRILEHLAVNRGRRTTRAQIFAAVYGMFDERVEECVVESHISKLRKKLRMELGFDPIDMQRYLGYQLVRKEAIAA